MKKKITVEAGSVWERKKGHGWRKKVVDVWDCLDYDVTYCSVLIDYNDGNGWQKDGVCSTDALKKWGNKK